MNSKGHPQTLQPRQPGNTNARRSGVYSTRFVAELAQPLVDEVMAASHVQSVDRFAAEEAGRLRALIALADDDLYRNGLTNRKGEPRSLLTHRLRASKQLERYLVQLGLTPLSRPQSVSASFADTFARLRAASEEAEDVS